LRAAIYNKISRSATRSMTYAAGQQFAELGFTSI